jgi:hypothetical protein
MTDTNKATSPREELARIIDPDTWVAYDVHIKLGHNIDPEDYCKRSLIKADEWLSRPPVKAASPEREELIDIISDAQLDVAANGLPFMPLESAEAVADAILSLPVQSVEAEPETFQERVGQWVVACFGDIVACDELERMDRAVEEFYEGLQARNYPRERLSALENYTWSRPVGEITQEFGGIMMTLAAWAQAIGLDMHACAEAELARVWTKVDQIRAKQAAKPVGSALPIAAPPKPSETPEPNDLSDGKVREFLLNWFAPWGSWKTAWWEGEVSDDVEMTDANALKHLRKLLPASAPEGAGRSQEAPHE